VAVGDLAAVARATGPDGAAVKSVNSLAEGAGLFKDHLPVLDHPLPRPAVPGSADPANAESIIAWIETAARQALAGEASALVTAPIAKAPLYEAGFTFAGHTEFLAEITGAQAVMMLAAQDLRCALVTIHEPLANVPGLLSQERIVSVGKTTADAIARDFGVARPRLAVAALNPHAGESGALGREESEIIAPAVRTLQDLGVDARGPFPADSLFHPAARSGYDAVLCMYHDQALIPVKMLDFWGGVNVTLGLPIVRTSPDHGVAFEIAGKGVARPDSLIAALRMAAEIAARRARV
jgi:4-hydroxythreonine-4-phosphate dehydrogenase